MAYITCKDLTLGYEGHAIVSDLNFKVSKGDYLCIVGENGTGKSTLIKTLLHLQDVISGDIITGDGLKAYEVGYLPQQTVVQKDFPATVEEIVLSGTLAKCGWRPFYRKAEKKLAEEKMKRMEVWNLRKSCYRNLSGGQQQRTLLARALCAASKVILLDEPVTGLDPKVTAEFYQVTKDLSEEGIAVIMVSHDVQALDYATHILHMQKKNSFYGTKEEYMNSDKWKLFKNAEDAATAVSRSIEATNAQDSMIAKASESFSGMNENVNTLVQEIEGIDGMLNRLSDANNQIVDNISNLSATTEEVTASSVQVADLSVENLNNAEQAKQKLDNVLAVSHELDKYIK